MKFLNIVKNSAIANNPTFVLLLGMCPTLGTTSSALNGLSMGLATTAVLVCSNGVISAIKSIVPDKVRIPVYIVVIATFVTLLQMLLAAYAPAINESLGIFIPLIVVNCILLGRAEAFASRNGVVASVADGLGCGIGFAAALTLLGACRELLGQGSIASIQIFSADSGALLFILAPGAFIMLGLLIAAYRIISIRRHDA